MPEANDISLAFLANRPAAAADLLEQYTPEEVAEFLKDAPLEALVPAIHEMASWPAARLLSQLPVARIADILRKLSASEAETLLRLIEEDLRNAILEKMPEAVAKNFHRKLVYPVSTIGAWMDTSVPYFTMDNSASDCLDLVKKQKRSLGGVVVVVNYDRKLIGLVEIDKLLTSPGDTKLATMVDRDLQPLASRATLSEVENDEGWIRFSTLPVVDRNNILLGVLTHTVLMSATAKTNWIENNNVRYSLITHMGRAFFVSLGGVIKMMSGVAESEHSVNPNHIYPQGGVSHD